MQKVEETYIEDINYRINEIINTNDIHSQLIKYIKACQEVKNFSSINVTNALIDCRNSLLDKLIIHYEPHYRTFLTNPNFKNLDGEELLNAIILYIRNQYAKTTTYKEKYENIRGFKGLNLTNRCFEFSQQISKILTDLNIENKIYEITPGFCQSSIKNRIVYHDIVIASINSTKYLIDASYSQFFNLKDNVLDALGIYNFGLPFPGIYMLQTKSRMQTAKTLLTQGWIKLTPQVIKDYFDGFALSYRNGLYWIDNGTNGYTTNYDENDYKRFLTTDEYSQLRYEKKEHLGIQEVVDHSHSEFDFTKDTVYYEGKHKKLIKIL